MAGGWVGGQSTLTFNVKFDFKSQIFWFYHCWKYITTEGISAFNVVLVNYYQCRKQNFWGTLLKKISLICSIQNSTYPGQFSTCLPQNALTLASGRALVSFTVMLIQFQLQSQLLIACSEHHRTRSALVQAMSFCLTAPSHYLNVD